MNSWDDYFNGAKQINDFKFKYIAEDDLSRVIKKVRRDRQKKQDEKIWAEFCKRKINVEGEGDAGFGNISEKTVFNEQELNAIHKTILKLDLNNVVPPQEMDHENNKTEETETKEKEIRPEKSEEKENNNTANNLDRIAKIDLSQFINLIDYIEPNIDAKTFEKQTELLENALAKLKPRGYASSNTAANPVADATPSTKPMKQKDTPKIPVLPNLETLDTNNGEGDTLLSTGHGTCHGDSPIFITFEDPMFSNRVKNIRIKIGNFLDKIKPLLYGVVDPNSPSELMNLRKRDIEFFARFSRNYLYPLSRQIFDISRYVKLARRPQYIQQTVTQIVIKAHQCVLYGLQCYVKHIPSSLEYGISEKLKEFLDSFTKLSQICIDNNIIPDDELKTRIENLYLLHNAEPYDCPDYLKPRNCKGAAVQMNPAKTKEAQKAAFAYSTATSPYSKKPTSNKKIAQKPSRLFHSFDSLLQDMGRQRIGRKPNKLLTAPIMPSKLKDKDHPQSQTTYSTSRPHLKTRKKKKPPYFMDDDIESEICPAVTPPTVMETLESQKSSSLNTADIQAIGNIARDAVHTTLQPLLQDLSRIINQNKSCTDEVVLNEVHGTTSQTSKDKNRPAALRSKRRMTFYDQDRQEPAGVNPMRSILRQTHHTRITEECEEEDEEGGETDGDGKERGGGRGVVGEYAALIAAMGGMDRKGGEKEGVVKVPSAVSVESSIGPKNAKLIYIKSTINQTGPGLLQKPQHENEKEEDLELKSRKSHHRNIKEHKKIKSYKNPELTKMNDNQKIIRHKIPERMRKEALKYKKKFLQYSMTKPMYNCSQDYKPWELISRIGDTIVDQLLTSLSKELSSEDILQNIYEMEFC